MRRLCSVLLVLSSFFASPLLAQGMNNWNMPGGDYKTFSAPTSQTCHNSCGGEPTCRSWTFEKAKRTCFLKNSQPSMVQNGCCVSGAIDQFTSQQMFIEAKVDRPGADFRTAKLPSAFACRDECARDHACSSWSYRQSDGACWLKNGVAAPVPNPSLASGVKYRPRNL